MADGGLGVPEDCFVPGRNARDSDSRRTGGRAPALAMSDRLWSEREVGRRCSSRCWLGRCGPAEVEVAQDALDDLGRRDECDESAAPAARAVEYVSVEGASFILHLSHLKRCQCRSCCPRLCPQHDPGSPEAERVPHPCNAGKPKKARCVNTAEVAGGYRRS